MECYYNKFLKYKSKYLKLLNEHNMKGGQENDNQLINYINGNNDNELINYINGNNDIQPSDTDNAISIYLDESSKELIVNEKKNELYRTTDDITNLENSLALFRNYNNDLQEKLEFIKGFDNCGNNKFFEKIKDKIDNSLKTLKSLLILRNKYHINNKEFILKKIKNNLDDIKYYNLNNSYGRLEIADNNNYRKLIESTVNLEFLFSLLSLDIDTDTIYQTLSEIKNNEIMNPVKKKFMINVINQLISRNETLYKINKLIIIVKNEFKEYECIPEKIYKFEIDTDFQIDNNIEFFKKTLNNNLGKIKADLEIIYSLEQDNIIDLLRKKFELNSTKVEDLENHLFSEYGSFKQIENEEIKKFLVNYYSDKVKIINLEDFLVNSSDEDKITNFEDYNNKILDNVYKNKISIEINEDDNYNLFKYCILYLEKKPPIDNDLTSRSIEYILLFLYFQELTRINLKDLVVHRSTSGGFKESIDYSQFFLLDLNDFIACKTLVDIDNMIDNKVNIDSLKVLIKSLFQEKIKKEKSIEISEVEIIESYSYLYNVLLKHVQEINFKINNFYVNGDNYVEPLVVRGLSKLYEYKDNLVDISQLEIFKFSFFKDIFDDLNYIINTYIPEHDPFLFIDNNENKQSCCESLKKFNKLFNNNIDQEIVAILNDKSIVEIFKSKDIIPANLKYLDSCVHYEIYNILKTYITIFDNKYFKKNNYSFGFKSNLKLDKNYDMNFFFDFIKAKIEQFIIPEINKTKNLSVYESIKKYICENLYNRKTKSRKFNLKLISDKFKEWERSKDKNNNKLNNLFNFIVLKSELDKIQKLNKSQSLKEEIDISKLNVLKQLKKTIFFELHNAPLDEKEIIENYFLFYDEPIMIYTVRLKENLKVGEENLEVGEVPPQDQNFFNDYKVEYMKGNGRINTNLNFNDHIEILKEYIKYYKKNIIDFNYYYEDILGKVNSEDYDKEDLVLVHENHYNYNKKKSLPQPPSLNEKVRFLSIRIVIENLKLDLINKENVLVLKKYYSLIKSDVDIEPLLYKSNYHTYLVNDEKGVYVIIFMLFEMNFINGYEMICLQNNLFTNGIIDTDPFYDYPIIETQLLDYFQSDNKINKNYYYIINLLVLIFGNYYQFTDLINSLDSGKNFYNKKKNKVYKKSKKTYKSICSDSKELTKEELNELNQLNTRISNYSKERSSLSIKDYIIDYQLKKKFNNKSRIKILSEYLCKGEDIHLYDNYFRIHNILYSWDYEWHKIDNEDSLFLINLFNAGYFDINDINWFKEELKKNYLFNYLPSNNDEFIIYEYEKNILIDYYTKVIGVYQEMFNTCNQIKNFSDVDIKQKLELKKEYTKKYNNYTYGIIDTSDTSDTSYNKSPLEVKKEIIINLFNDLTLDCENVTNDKCQSTEGCIYENGECKKHSSINIIKNFFDNDKLKRFLNFPDYDFKIENEARVEAKATVEKKEKARVEEKEKARLKAKSENSFIAFSELESESESELELESESESELELESESKSESKSESYSESESKSESYSELEEKIVNKYKFYELFVELFNYKFLNDHINDKNLNSSKKTKFLNDIKNKLFLGLKKKINSLSPSPQIKIINKKLEDMLKYSELDNKQMTNKQINLSKQLDDEFNKKQMTNKQINLSKQWDDEFNKKQIIINYKIDIIKRKIECYYHILKLIEDKSNVNNIINETDNYIINFQNKIMDINNFMFYYYSIKKIQYDINTRQDISEISNRDDNKEIINEFNKEFTIYEKICNGNIDKDYLDGILNLSSTIKKNWGIPTDILLTEENKKKIANKLSINWDSNSLKYSFFGKLFYGHNKEKKIKEILKDYKKLLKNKFKNEIKNEIKKEPEVIPKNLENIYNFYINNCNSFIKVDGSEFSKDLESINDFKNLVNSIKRSPEEIKKEIKKVANGRYKILNGIDVDYLFLSINQFKSYNKNTEKLDDDEKLRSELAKMIDFYESKLYLNSDLLKSSFFSKLISKLLEVKSFIKIIELTGKELFDLFNLFNSLTEPTDKKRTEYKTRTEDNTLTYFTAFFEEVSSDFDKKSDKDISLLRIFDTFLTSNQTPPYSIPIYSDNFYELQDNSIELQDNSIELQDNSIELVVIKADSSSDYEPAYLVNNSYIRDIEGKFYKYINKNIPVKKFNEKTIFLKEFSSSIEFTSSKKFKSLVFENENLDLYDKFTDKEHTGDYINLKEISKDHEKYYFDRNFDRNCVCIESESNKVRLDLTYANAVQPINVEYFNKLFITIKNNISNILYSKDSKVKRELIKSYDVKKIAKNFSEMTELNKMTKLTYEEKYKISININYNEFKSLFEQLYDFVNPVDNSPITCKDIPDFVEGVYNIFKNNKFMLSKNLISKINDIVDGYNKICKPPKKIIIPDPTKAQKLRSSKIYLYEKYNYSLNKRFAELNYKYKERTIEDNDDYNLLQKILNIDDKDKSSTCNICEQIDEYLESCLADDDLILTDDDSILTEVDEGFTTFKSIIKSINVEIDKIKNNISNSLYLKNSKVERELIKSSEVKKIAKNFSEMTELNKMTELTNEEKYKISININYNEFKSLFEKLYDFVNPVDNYLITCKDIPDFVEGVYNIFTEKKFMLSDNLISKINDIVDGYNKICKPPKKIIIPDPTNAQKLRSSKIYLYEKYNYSLKKRFAELHDNKERTPDLNKDYEKLKEILRIKNPSSICNICEQIDEYLESFLADDDSILEVVDEGLTTFKSINDEIDKIKNNISNILYDSKVEKKLIKSSDVKKIAKNFSEMTELNKMTELTYEEKYKISININYNEFKSLFEELYEFVNNYLITCKNIPDFVEGVYNIFTEKKFMLSQNLINIINKIVDKYNKICKPPKKIIIPDPTNAQKLRSCKIKLYENYNYSLNKRFAELHLKYKKRTLEDNDDYNLLQKILNIDDKDKSSTCNICEQIDEYLESRLEVDDEGWETVKKDKSINDKFDKICNSQGKKGGSMYVIDNPLDSEFYNSDNESNTLYSKYVVDDPYDSDYYE